MSAVIYLDSYPVWVRGLKHIKGTLYEARADISEDNILENENFLDDYLKHCIAQYREDGFFVKRVYNKFYVAIMGIRIYIFELIKLRETVIEK